MQNRTLKTNYCTNS